jgi:hypothetical protein
MNKSVFYLSIYESLFDFVVYTEKIYIIHITKIVLFILTITHIMRIVASEQKRSDYIRSIIHWWLFSSFFVPLPPFFQSCYLITPFIRSSFSCSGLARKVNSSHRLDKICIVFIYRTDP